MMILSYMKGKTTFTELMNIPNRILQTFYYKSWLEASKRLEQDKNGKSGISPNDVEEIIDEIGG